MKTDLQQLKIFRECPAKYKFSYLDKVEPAFMDVLIWSEYVLQKLFARYIYHELGGVTTQLHTMQKNFKEQWNSSVHPLGPADVADEMKTISLISLYNFWKCFSDFFAPTEKTDPYILPNLPFNVRRVEWTTPKKHVIKGYIDAVYLNIVGPNIVKWVHYPPHSGYVDTEYETLLYAYAYRKKTSHVPVEILIFYLYDATSVSLGGSNTHLCLRFYDYLIDAFCVAQNTRNYYPRLGNHCRRCPYNKHCMEKHGIDFEGGIKYGRQQRYPRLTGPSSKVQRLSPMSELRRAFAF